MINIHKLDVKSIPLSDLKSKDGSFKYDKSSEQFGMSVTLQYEILKNLLKKDGQIEPILIYRGFICDGRNRCKGLDELEVEMVLVKELPYKCSLEERMDLARSIENGRRHNSVTQFACIASKEYFRRKEVGIKVVNDDIYKEYPVKPSALTPAKKLFEFQPTIFDILFEGGSVNINPDNPGLTTSHLQSIWKYYRLKMEREKREAEARLNEEASRASSDTGGDIADMLSENGIELPDVSEGGGSQELALLFQQVERLIGSLKGLSYSDEDISYVLVESGQNLITKDEK